ncbi:TraB/GumN family protein [Pseudoxanthomonas daejeonensis]|uniref:TraB/GumN family protein n=1 Tax=Pseudoxanthomonas daejeonensis TaxID=266062 RepID=UPI001F5405A6|nr:TraB/GumN family protein [Pseudoxanthomonas daejeonensis]UNK57697.1 TraB/GumN family protein [Pseudoxanthomonas daejeonensis]
MMIRALRHLATALVVLAAATLPAQAEPPVPLLWKVSDADNAIYLLGSFHLLTPADYPLAADVDAAYADAEALVFELSPEEVASPALPAQMARAAMRTRPGTLQDDLGPGQWARLEAYAKANNLPLQQLAAFEPWFIGLTVSLMEMGKMGLDPALGLDRHFMDAAASARKPTAGLERADEQIAVLAGMSLPEQKQMLAEALQQAEEGPEKYRDLHQAWRAGDAERMWKEMAAEMKRDYPALYRRINVERNDAWLPRLEQRLAQKDDDTLVVVGALHLLGEDGVVEKLRAKGYKVERICSACTR